MRPSLSPPCFCLPLLCLAGLWGCTGDVKQKWYLDGKLIRYYANNKYCLDLPGMLARQSSHYEIGRVVWIRVVVTATDRIRRSGRFGPTYLPLLPPGLTRRFVSAGSPITLCPVPGGF